MLPEEGEKWGLQTDCEVKHVGRFGEKRASPPLLGVLLGRGELSDSVLITCGEPAYCGRAFLHRQSAGRRGGDRQRDRRGRSRLLLLGAPLDFQASIAPPGR